MMQKKSLLFLLVLCHNLFFSQSIRGFHIPDSLETKTYAQLDIGYQRVFRINNDKAEVYANTIISKAKREKNDIKLADGYVLLHRVVNGDKILCYLDSMIVISKKLHDSDYISDGYMYKGTYYYSKGEYSKSLNNYLAAKEYVNKNSETYYIINFDIGLLKLELEEYEEAIKLFLEYKNYLNQYDLIKRIDYQSCVYALAYTFSKMNKLDSSDYYVKIGLSRNLGIKYKRSQSHLLLVSGINAYKRNSYEKALPILNNASRLIRNNSDDTQNLALCEYYRGKILYNNSDKEFLNKFKIIDSIIIKTHNASPELRDIYPIYIDYYKKKGYKEKQLYYIERLLAFDSMMHKKNRILSKEINKKYDTPLLLKEKDDLISDLDTKNHTLFWFLGIGGMLIVTLFIVYVENRKTIKNYKNRAMILIQPSPSVDFIKEKKNIPPQNIDKQEEKSKNELSDDQLLQLSIKLEEFEKARTFLDKNINLDILSKEFNTNRVYLSKSINILKGQTFPQYLNQLKIHYILEELKTNSKLHKLTIAAIAEEAGFNTSESFSNAFKKITGTLPSYFIKALQEFNNL